MTEGAVSLSSPSALPLLLFLFLLPFSIFLLLFSFLSSLPFGSILSLPGSFSFSFFFMFEISAREETAAASRVIPSGGVY